MSYFKESVEKVNQKFYLPNQFVIENLREEPQNTEYAGGIFHLNQQSIRFRVAKITPTKIGQFVAFWEKNEMDKNQAFHEEESPEFLVVTTFQEERMGQFVFPKAVLIKKRILRTGVEKGKMAIRVYPAWDCPISKQAIATQKWQLAYFVEMSENQEAVMARLTELYGGGLKC